MNRRRLLAAAGTATTASLAGCARFSGGSEEGRLDLTVRNDGNAPVDVQVTVVDDGGTTYADESDRIDAGVARAFEVTVGTGGRHEATVSGEDSTASDEDSTASDEDSTASDEDWSGQVAWNAGACALYEGTVVVTEERLDVVSECVQDR